MALASIVLLATGLLSYQIGRPYCKMWEHGEVEIRARNFLDEGFWRLRFLPVRNLMGGTPNYYLNHPPLAVIVLALFMRFLGDAEISARLSVIIPALASLWLLYKIIRLEISEKLALMTILVVVLLPQYFYNGRIVSLYPFTLFISLLTIWLFLQAGSSPEVGYKLALFISVLLGVMSDWSYYLIPPSLLIFSLIRRRGWKLALGVIVAQLAFFALMMVYFNAVAGILDGTESPLTIFGGTRYLKIAGPGRWLLTLDIFYQRLWERMKDCFTPLVCVLAACGLVVNFFSRDKRRDILALSSLFLFSAILFIPLAPTSVYYHDFGLYPFIPAMAFLSSSLLLKLPLLIRSVVLIILVFFSGVQFQSFHAPIYCLPYRTGQAIRRASISGETIFAPRGPPLAYYSQLPTQFIFPGPPFLEILADYQPTWIVFSPGDEQIMRTSLEKAYAGLNRKGYFRICRAGYEVWKRTEPGSDGYLLATLLAPEQEQSGWETRLVTLGSESLFAVCGNLNEGASKELIFSDLNISYGSWLEVCIGYTIHNPDRNQTVEFIISILDNNQEEAIIAKQIYSSPEKTQAGWTPVEADLSNYTGETISLKLQTVFSGLGQTSTLEAFWGNMRIVSPEGRTSTTLTGN